MYIDYNDFFREATFRQIFTRATDWPRLTSAHPQGERGSPQKNLIVKIQNLA